MSRRIEVRVIETITYQFTTEVADDFDDNDYDLVEEIWLDVPEPNSHLVSIDERTIDVREAS